ncbi:unnamed protein product [Amoebophrya sp. A25]|nr:unnamed protein product [Amoebophrya sp. A25]|eukprot:GSA25T00019964001.1
MASHLDPYMPITAGVAVSLLTGHCLVTKALQTILFRLKITDASTPDAEVKKVVESTFYKRVWAAQLNEAEYAPVLIAGLGYLALKGKECSAAATLAVVGQVWYYWTRAFIGNSKEGGVHPPPYVPGVFMRHFALGFIAYEMWCCASK